MFAQRLEDILSPIARRRAEMGISQARLQVLTVATGEPVSISTIQLAERGIVSARTARILSRILALDTESLLPKRPPAPNGEV
jgi:hypothetical protein